MIFVSADHVVEVLLFGAEFLQFGKELQTRVPNRQMHELRAVRDTLRLACSSRRGQHREVAATVPASHHSDLSLGQHLVVSDPLRLALERGEDVTHSRRVVVVEDGLYQDLPYGPQ